VLVSIVGLFTLLLVNSVISRYLFQLPIGTSIEITRIAFVWAAFLGVALVSLAPPALGSHNRARLLLRFRAADGFARLGADEAHVRDDVSDARDIAGMALLSHSSHRRALSRERLTARTDMQ
jgi:hypothetical protein